MRSAAPDIIAPRGMERGLVATIVVSALIHAGAIGLLITIPGRFLSDPQQLQSYTVDLIAPNVVGGTNLVAGAGPKPAPPAAEVGPVVPPAAESKTVGAQAALPKPPKSSAQGPQAPPPAAAKPEPKPEPPKPEPAKAKPIAEAKPPPRAEPPPKTKADPPKLPVKSADSKAKPLKPAAKAEQVSKAKAEPPPKPKPAQTKPVAKAEPPAKPDTKPNAEAKANAEAKPKPDVKAKAEAKPKPVDPAAKAAEQRDQAINAAVERRAAEAAQATKADKQIAAAVQRRAAQVEKGGGGAVAGIGGPISSGPGSGAGGTPTDLQFVLYHGRMIERIKSAWAWTGADRSLSVVIQFNLAPDGQVRNVRTIQSSGDPSYDASAERAVRAVNPLEPVPDKYRDDFATIELTFRASDLES